MNNETVRVYLLLDAEGNAVNSVLWDGETPYTLEEGQRLVPAEQEPTP